jgi:hypothetical protein
LLPEGDWLNRQSGEQTLGGSEITARSGHKQRQAGRKSPKTSPGRVTVCCSVALSVWAWV